MGKQSLGRFGPVKMARPSIFTWFSYFIILFTIQGGRGEIDVQDVLNRLIQVEEDQSGFKKVQDLILARLNIAEQNIISMKNDVQTNSETSQKVLQLEEVNDEIEYLKELSKLTTARSCAELKSFGINFNGTEEVPIDPDGSVKGHPPLDVICDMDTGTTEGGDEVTGTIDTCDGSGCSEIIVDYPGHIDQIKNLIMVSESCSQEISFKCFGSALKINSVHIGWWVNTQGEQKYSINGNGSTYGCECGLTDSCLTNIGENNLCNCDARLARWAEDKGVITSKEDLPIVAFKYGTYSLEGYHPEIRIGKLKCQGIVATPSNTDVAIEELGDRIESIEELPNQNKLAIDRIDDKFDEKFEDQNKINQDIKKNFRKQNRRFS